MKLVARWVLSLTLGCLVAAQTVPDDPVMKARAQRAAAQGIQEDDLPPVPRSVMEPPPLPPPEIHAKDLPQPKVAKPAKSGRVSRKAGRRAQAAAAAEDPPARTSKRATVKPGSRRGKATAAPAGKRAAGKATPPANRAGRKPARKGKA